MPYDPRMLQMARMGVDMLGPPPQPPPFAAVPTSQSQPQRQRQWWETVPQGRLGGIGQSANQPANSPNQSATSQPPSLLDMLMKTGGTTGRPGLGPIPSMGLANMPASMWGQLSGLYGGRR